MANPVCEEQHKARSESNGAVAHATGQPHAMQAVVNQSSLPPSCLYIITPTCSHTRRAILFGYP